MYPQLVWNIYFKFDSPKLRIDGAIRGASLTAESCSCLFIRSVKYCTIHYDENIYRLCWLFIYFLIYTTRNWVVFRKSTQTFDFCFVKMLIKTFVFFDIETTGLPNLEFNRTKITECAFVACTKVEMQEHVKKKMPRVVHKLTFCVNPRKMIHPDSSKITGNN